MKELLPESLLRLAKEMPEPLYVVGGFVRDFLSGRTCAEPDLDICSPTDADSFVAAAERCGLTPVAVYRHTGTVKLKDGEKVVFEIRNMEFTNAGQSDENRRQNLAFDQWRRNYSPDYSDSSKYLDPPREGRIASPLPIVRDGKPCAEIIFARGIEPECVETAANELQMWIEKITGAKLPVLTYPSGADNTKLFLGKRVPKISAGPKLFADELKTLADSDGYAVRTSGREIYIFGATGKGTMNGVFAFLMNNTDLIWPRPGCTVNEES